ncbi:putative MFS family arabinose efflux permease [Streptomyces sp. SAI-117]|uniref:MFS transporter n=1 Tax=Streptomyces sp. SAI-117 TaxID=2940546 RepID=UPI0024754780|nr:MFS transporter [Streptomyces sp. SAI-117]MDH6567028.1 putative MFS family arabinose efflux permease [Streptomyces sp. SAI-117]
MSGGAGARDRVDASAAVRLAVLASATFVYVTFEVFPVGLLQDIARDLDVPAGRVGLLISGYALVAAVVTVPTVALASRVSRGTALVVSLLVLVVAEVLAGFATSFAMMVVSRVAAALTHGVLWSLIAPAAATLVPRHRVGTATAAVFGGSTLAAIVGSPGTTLIGELIGWRATALVLAAATVAVTVGLVWALGLHGPTRPAAGAPGTEAGAGEPDGTAGAGRRGAHWPRVLTLCAVAVVLISAHFLSYTYFAVLVTEVTGTSAATVGLLAVFGCAGAVGTWLVGRYNDTVPRRTASVTIAVFAVGVGLLAVASVLGGGVLARGTAAAVAVALWGGAFAAAGPVFQTGVMRLAGPEADRASSVYVTGFQIGIASGSALGAVLLGRSALWLPVGSTVLVALVLLVVLVRRPVPTADVPDNQHVTVRV